MTEIQTALKNTLTANILIPPPPTNHDLACVCAQFYRCDCIPWCVKVLIASFVSCVPQQTIKAHCENPCSPIFFFCFVTSRSLILENRFAFFFPLWCDAPQHALAVLLTNTKTKSPVLQHLKIAVLLRHTRPLVTRSLRLRGLLV